MFSVKYELNFKVVCRRISGLKSAVPWPRYLVADLSLRRPVLYPVSFHVRFLVDKVAMGQVFLQVPWFFPVTVIPSVLHSHIHPPAALLRG
jgi:hypothetical protein